MTDPALPLLVCDAVDLEVARFVIEEPPEGVSPLVHAAMTEMPEEAILAEGVAYRVPYRRGQWVWAELQEDEASTQELQDATATLREELLARQPDDRRALPPITLDDTARDDIRPVPPLAPRDPDAP